jgi:hypothetical protein
MYDYRLANLPATAPRCYALLTWLEEAFDCSINFWLSVEKYGSGPPVFWLYAAGSGNVFDHPNFAGLVHRSRVLEAMDGSCFAALWQILIQLEAEFAALQVPRIERPTL